MENIDSFIESAEKFYHQTIADGNGRFRSWEHCYSVFHEARNQESADTDNLSLHLAFYLASWGMYRGSSFLLQKDYKVHTPIIEELLKKEYDVLFGIECAKYKDKAVCCLLQELNVKIDSYYASIRKSVKDSVAKHISDTLVTKILMGTMGCVPAYDRYFINGIKKQKAATGTYNIGSIRMLADFYVGNFEKLEKVRSCFNINGLPYPQMKLLDMGFWQIGLENGAE